MVIAMGVFSENCPITITIFPLWRGERLIFETFFGLIVLGFFALFIVLGQLTCLLKEFVSCFGHLLTEFRTGMQDGIADAGGNTAGIHVALPVGTHNHTALAILPTARKDIVGSCRVDFGKQ